MHVRLPRGVSYSDLTEKADRSPPPRISRQNLREGHQQSWLLRLVIIHPGSGSPVISRQLDPLYLLDQIEK